MSKASRFSKANEVNDIALANFRLGCGIVSKHPIFAVLYDHVNIVRQEYSRLPQDGLAVVTQDGRIYAHPKIRAEPEVWARTLAHCLLHLGMGHFVKKENWIYWNVACDCAIEKFLSDLRFGKPDQGSALLPGVNQEEKLYLRFLEEGLKAEYVGFGTAGERASDMIFSSKESVRLRPRNWTAAFATGLGLAVRSAVDVAGGYKETLDYDSRTSQSPAALAKAWFISTYPLLGAIAAGFKLIEDRSLCQRMEIQIAAISCPLQEIYINPAAGLSKEECRFVLAHEFLHAALRHDVRHEWREAYLWNVACDYVINAWLIEMGLGEPPQGLLYDEQFKGLNAEAVYDRIVSDLRRFRKLATLRGTGLGDILPGTANWWERGEGVDLDAFYRRAIGQGLEYHQSEGRGYLPEGLIEEIRALSHPPIPWDVELARWFDEQFQPIEKIRSYARPSRRQSSTPDIPRPSYAENQEARKGRTFGVVLDTSGSIDRALLAVALGAIASYSVAREVQGVRVIFCDAQAYDEGYKRPEDIAGSVQVKGRGGTVLQPGIDLLLQAEDFPKNGPILLISDGQCDEHLAFQGREHAYLIPKGASLPFVPKGKVFRVES